MVSRRRRYTDFWEVELRRCAAGDFSRVALQAESAASPGDEVVITARVSPTRNKKRDLKKLTRQGDDLRRIAGELGLVVAGIVLHRGWGTDLAWIKDAAKMARALCREPALLAERPSRVCRSQNFIPGKRTEFQPTEDELDELRLVLRGVKLMTVMPPNATPRDEASYRSTRGQRTTGHTGGGDKSPGYKKRRREAMHKSIWLLYRPVDGVHLYKVREIAAITGVPRSNVRRWVKRNPFATK